MEGRRPFIQKVSGVIGAGAVVGAAGCLSGDDFEDITVGGGGSATDAFATSSLLQQVVSEHLDDVVLTTQTTGGVLANQELLFNGTVDAGIVMPTMFHWQMQGEQTFDGETPPDEDDMPLQGGLPPFFTEQYVMARQGTGIETYDDLPGTTFWPFWTGSAARPLMEAVFEHIGLLEQLDLFDISQEEVSGSLSEGSVDAIGMYQVGGELVAWGQKVDAQADVTPVQIPDDTWSELQEMQAPNTREEVELDWENHDFDLDSVRGWFNTGEFMWHSHIPEDVVYDITMLAYEQADHISQATGSTPNFSDPEIMVEPILDPYPIHPGAAEVFQELDVWNDDWTVGEAD